jgi:ribonuclease-3
MDLTDLPRYAFTLQMYNSINKDLLHQIERSIGYSFRDERYLAQALTHSSAADDRLASNERLEFLGDSVLALVICQTLYERFPNYLEGDLTKVKSALVSRASCAKVARKLDLKSALKMGKGMSSVRTIPRSLEAGVIEAVIGAIYLDGGFKEAEAFILRTFDSLLEKAYNESTHGNYKSLLQQYSQDKYGVTPTYVLLDEKGPDHNKCFESEVILDEHHFSSAWGVTKKEAEQRAALNALRELGVLNPSETEERYEV